MHMLDDWSLPNLMLSYLLFFLISSTSSLCLLFQTQQSTVQNQSDMHLLNMFKNVPFSLNSRSVSVYLENKRLLQNVSIRTSKWKNWFIENLANKLRHPLHVFCLFLVYFMGNSST